MADPALGDGYLSGLVLDGLGSSQCRVDKIVLPAEPDTSKASPMRAFWEMAKIVFWYLALPMGATAIFLTVLYNLLAPMN